jgi:hypothetical protein
MDMKLGLDVSTLQQQWVSPETNSTAVAQPKTMPQTPQDSMVSATTAADGVKNAALYSREASMPALTQPESTLLRPSEMTKPSATEIMGMSNLSGSDSVAGYERGVAFDQAIQDKRNIQTTPSSLAYNKDALTKSRSLAPLNEDAVSQLAEQYGVTPEQVRGAHNFAIAHPDTPLEQPFQTIVKEIKQQPVPLPGDLGLKEQAFNKMVSSNTEGIEKLASQLGISVQEARALVRQAGTFLLYPQVKQEIPSPEVLKFARQLQSQSNSLITSHKEGYAYTRALDNAGDVVTQTAEELGLPAADVQEQLSSLGLLNGLATAAKLPIAHLRIIVQAMRQPQTQPLNGEQVGVLAALTKESPERIQLQHKSGELTASVARALGELTNKPMKVVAEQLTAIPSSTIVTSEPVIDRLASDLMAEAVHFTEAPEVNVKASFESFIADPTADGSSFGVLVQDKMQRLLLALKISQQTLVKQLTQARQQPEASLPPAVKSLAQEIEGHIEGTLKTEFTSKVAEQSFEAVLNEREGPVADRIGRFAQLLRTTPADIRSLMRDFHKAPAAEPSSGTLGALQSYTQTLEQESAQYAVTAYKAQMTDTQAGDHLNNTAHAIFEKTLTDAGYATIRPKIYFAAENPGLVRQLDPAIVQIAERIKAHVSEQLKQTMGVPASWSAPLAAGVSTGTRLYDETFEAALYQKVGAGEIGDEDVAPLKALHYLRNETVKPPPSQRLLTLSAAIDKEVIPQVRSKLGAPANWIPQPNTADFRMSQNYHYKTAIEGQLDQISSRHVATTSQATSMTAETTVSLTAEKSNLNVLPADVVSAEDVPAMRTALSGGNVRMTPDLQAKVYQVQTEATVTVQERYGVQVDTTALPAVPLAKARNSSPQLQRTKDAVNSMSESYDLHLSLLKTITQGKVRADSIVTVFQDYLRITGAATMQFKEVIYKIESTSAQAAKVMQLTALEMRKSELNRLKDMIEKRTEAIESASSGWDDAKKIITFTLAVIAIAVISMIPGMQGFALTLIAVFAATATAMQAAFDKPFNIEDILYSMANMMTLQFSTAAEVVGAPQWMVITIMVIQIIVDIIISIAISILTAGSGTAAAVGKIASTAAEISINAAKTAITAARTATTIAKAASEIARAAVTITQVAVKATAEIATVVVKATIKAVVRQIKDAIKSVGNLANKVTEVSKSAFNSLRGVRTGAEATQAANSVRSLQAIDKIDSAASLTKVDNIADVNKLEGVATVGQAGKALGTAATVADKTASFASMAGKAADAIVDIAKPLMKAAKEAMRATQNALKEIWTLLKEIPKNAKNFQTILDRSVQAARNIGQQLSQWWDEMARVISTGVKEAVHGGIEGMKSFGREVGRYSQQLLGQMLKNNIEDLDDLLKWAGKASGKADDANSSINKARGGLDKLRKTLKIGEDGAGVVDKADKLTKTAERLTRTFERVEGAMNAINSIQSGVTEIQKGLYTIKQGELQYEIAKFNGWKMMNDTMIAALEQTAKVLMDDLGALTKLLKQLSQERSHFWRGLNDMTTKLSGAI